jgi:hypothetical protein
VKKTLSTQFKLKLYSYKNDFFFSKKEKKMVLLASEDNFQEREEQCYYERERKPGIV